MPASDSLRIVEGLTTIPSNFDPKETTDRLFGNARGGTPLMQASQTAGIDLPLKALVWQDAAGKTWLSYNEPSWIVQRQGLGVRAEIVDNMTAALSAISRKAAGVA